MAIDQDHNHDHRPARITSGSKTATDPSEALQSAYDTLQNEFGVFFTTRQIETRCLNESGAEAIDLSFTEEETWHQDGHRYPAIFGGFLYGWLIFRPISPNVQGA